MGSDGAGEGGGDVLASEHCDCVIHSCNNYFFLLIQFVAIDILVLVL